MNHSHPVDKVSLAAIDFDNSVYSVWAWSESERIRESIRSVGIQVPPVLCESPAGRLAVVSGHKRLRASKSLGRRSVTCIIAPTPADPLDYLIPVVFENLSFRQYNLVEKGMICARLVGQTGCGYPIDILRQNLGVGRHNSLHIIALADLSDSVKKAIACGQVDERVALEFPQWSLRDQQAFIEYIGKTGVGTNAQRKTWAVLKGLSSAKGTSPAKSLNTPELRKVLEKPTWNGRQKADHVWELLQKSHSPRVQYAKKAFLAGKGKLPFPAGARLLNASPFEEDELKLEVRVSKPEDLTRISRAFDRLARHKDLPDFIRISTGIAGARSEAGETQAGDRVATRKAKPR